jgi:hypothetical protein
MSLVKDEQDNEYIIQVNIEGRPLYARVWQMHVERASHYLTI